MKGGEKVVKICDGWYYSANDNEYVLIHEYEYESIDFQTREKTGEIKSRRVEVGYFSTLAAMLTKLVTILGKEKIASGEITTLSEHVEELRRIKQELENDILPF